MGESKFVKMTLAELRAEAERLGLNPKGEAERSELIALLEATQGGEKAQSLQTRAKPEGLQTPAAAASAQVKASAKAERAEAEGELEDEAAEAERAGAEGELKDEAAESSAVGPKAQAELKIEVEPPKEPDCVYIDRGAILPQFIPGTALYALIRDPGTLFVYWNADFESPHGWLLTAYDATGQVVQQFQSRERRNGRGYFRVPAYEIVRVTLSQMHAEGHAEIKLESRIRLHPQFEAGRHEKWIDVKNGDVVYEAPAPGRIENSSEQQGHLERRLSLTGRVEANFTAPSSWVSARRKDQPYLGSSGLQYQRS